MNKKLILTIFLGMFLISLVNAGEAGEVLSQGAKVGETYYIPQNCQECTYVTLSRIGNQYVTINMTKNSSDSSSWYYPYTWNESGTIPIEGYFDPDGVVRSFNYYIPVSLRGWDLSLGGVLVYLTFLLGCIVLTYYSVKLVKFHPFTEDMIFNEKNYKEREEDRVKFYVKLIKSKLYILGYFGFYLSVLLALSFFNQLTYTVGIEELSSLFNNLVIILGWGLIPFLCFWLVYLIVYFYKSTEKILKFQLGGWGRWENERKQ